MSGLCWFGRVLPLLSDGSAGVCQRAHAAALTRIPCDFLVFGMKKRGQLQSVESQRAPAVRALQGNELGTSRKPRLAAAVGFARWRSEQATGSTRTRR